MFEYSCRIYLTANSIIYLFCAVLIFPEGLLFGFVAMAISSVFSLPALFLLQCCLLLIEKFSPRVIICWLSMLLTVTAGVLIPLLIFDVDILRSSNTGFVWIVAGAGFGALSIQSIHLHNFFKSLQYENN